MFGVPGPDVAFDYLSTKMKNNFNETIKTILNKNNNNNNNFDVVPSSQFQPLLWFPTLCNPSSLEFVQTCWVGRQVSFF